MAEHLVPVVVRASVPITVHEAAVLQPYDLQCSILSGRTYPLLEPTYAGAVMQASAGTPSLRSHNIA